ncbi:transglycosylase domain-containing protein [Mycoplasma sp. P36-A1]|uniref:transglycosylase domain-containing protein n=1 Tax=Mycoplasma sp. P36-A1 TaxID=3252900 RepID=UPI003C2AD04B
MSKDKKNKKNKSTILKVFDVFLNLSFVGMIAVGVLSIYMYSNLPDLEIASMVRPNDSYVYDNNKKLIGTISRKEENQENVKYSALNQSLINILVGTEDSSYFTHGGIDVINTLESGFKSIILNSDSKSGGSSITQQIIGWTHLDRNEKSVTRKVKEIMLAIKAEKEIDKTEIMELYFNYFFYGKNNIHGIERASEYFFDKKAYQLDAVQSALMVGTLNSPSTYNPLGYHDEKDGTYINNSKNRLNNVLLASKNQGYLSEPEFYLLQQVQVENTVKINNQSRTTEYGSYIDVVKREMEDTYKADFKNNSYKIYTTMDKKAQKYANKIQKGEILALPDKDMNFGFMLTKTQTGEIQAVGGGKQYKNGGISLLNNAIDLQNQPGSAFKPIIDYAPTFEFLHWSDRQPISNAAMNYPGTNTSIRNFDGKSGGTLTMDKALESSRNLTAVRALEAVVNKVGFKGLNKYLTKLGFNFKTSELTYAYALGGTQTGVSPKQMNGAYQAFGNGGYYIEPHTVTSFVDQTTNKKTEKTIKKERAVDERTAFMMSNSLERATKGNSSGLLSAANFSQAPYVAKTGTSNWGKEGARYGIPNLSAKDSWYTGYTSVYTMSVWTGYDTKGIEKGKWPQWGSQHDYAATIWGAVMRKMVTGDETSYMDQKAPSGIVRGSNGAWVYK